jgi:XTP/dITP diphosphohydrolase
MRHEHDPTPIIVQAAWEGEILREARGKEGFGYDPLFWVPTHNCASAELNAEEKNRISHRALAMKKLKQALEKAAE